MRNSHVFLCHKSEQKIILISQSGWSPSARTKHDRYEPSADSTLHGVVFEILRPVPVVHCRGGTGSAGLRPVQTTPTRHARGGRARALQPLRRLVSLNSRPERMRMTIAPRILATPQSRVGVDRVVARGITRNTQRGRDAKASHRSTCAALLPYGAVMKKHRYA
jgi:hypothetical protein